MKNYYNILDIELEQVNTKIIKKAYKIKISQFNKLPFLTKDMIIDIKNIKEAYYVLKNERFKHIYDKKMKIQNNKKSSVISKFDSNDSNNTKICDRMFSLHL